MRRRRLRLSHSDEWVIDVAARKQLNRRLHLLRKNFFARVNLGVINDILIACSDDTSDQAARDILGIDMPSYSEVSRYEWIQKNEPDSTLAFVYLAKALNQRRYAPRLAERPIEFWHKQWKNWRANARDTIYYRNKVYVRAEDLAASERLISVSGS